MKCKNVINILSDYIDGNLSPDKVKEVEKHLLECQTCNKTCQDMKQLVNSLHDMKIPVDEEESLRVFRASLNEKKISAVHLLTMSQLTKSLSVAATIILCIAGLYVLIHSMNDKSTTQVAQQDAAKEEIVIPTEEKTREQQIAQHKKTDEAVRLSDQSSQPAVSEPTQLVASQSPGKEQTELGMSADELMNIPVTLTLILNRKKVEPDFASIDSSKPPVYKTVEYDDGTVAKEYDPSGKGGTVLMNRDNVVNDMFVKTSSLVDSMGGTILGTCIDTGDSSIPVQFMVVSIPEAHYPVFVEKINALFEADKLEPFESIEQSSDTESSFSEKSDFKQLKIIFNSIK